MLRTLKYSRYLLEHGWRTTVIAPNESAYDVIDKKLADQIPGAVRVIRTHFLNTKRNLSIRGIYPAILAVPDTWIGWMPWAVKAGRALLQRDPYDLIYSTSPHATAHIIALRLSASSQKPWVTDFRDPWNEDPPEPGAPNGVVYRWANRTLERKVIHKCSRVVASTTQLRDLLRERYASEPSDKFDAILNGYDEEDFASLPAASNERADKLLMLHAGGINADFRDPIPLFEALRKVADTGAIDLRKLCVRFIGPGAYGDSVGLRRCVKTLGLDEVVDFLQRVSYNEALQELNRAGVLLLVHSSPDTANLVPAKLYEYLRAYKSVLALVCPGATADIVEATHGGWAVAPDHASKLQVILSNIFDRWVLGKLGEERADSEVLWQFDRRSLTGKLAAIFDQLLSPV